jgi:TolB-like protein
MKASISVFLTLFLAIVAPVTAGADFSKTKIAVLDFQLQGEEFDNKDMGNIVAEWFTTAMVREGRFDVIERRMLEKILGEQKLALSGVVDAESATQIGKLLGVKVIISGSVMKLKEITEINARIIDVESASIIAAENVRSTATGRLQDLVVEMSEKIIKNFPLEGYVVNRSGDSLTIDLGLRTGVKKGMRFIVYKEGQIIKHPKTGEVLDVERIETGKITIENVSQKICIATIDEEESPGAINYGQQVKSLVDMAPKQAKLTVTASPANAKVRILNIPKPYEPGITLDPGPYHVEVSAPGFKTSKEWVSLEKNSDKNHSVSLVAAAQGGEDTPPRTAAATKKEPTWTPPPVDAQPPPPPDPPLLSAEQSKYIRMLEAGEREQKDAAKRLVKAKYRDTTVLDVVEKVLLRKYQTADDDTMSWLCKALGASGQGKYKATLSKVANSASSRKLKRYAEESLEQL